MVLVAVFASWLLLAEIATAQSLSLETDDCGKNFAFFHVHRGGPIVATNTSLCAHLHPSTSAITLEHCIENDLHQSWFLRESGQIQSMLDPSLCWSLLASNTKTPIVAAPCRTSDNANTFLVENFRIRMKQTPSMCVSHALAGVYSVAVCWTSPSRLVMPTRVDAPILQTRSITA